MKSNFFFVALFVLFSVSFQQISAKVYVLIRNDDISYKTDVQFEYEVLSIFKKYKIRPLYAIIPAKDGVPLERSMPIVDSLQNWYNNKYIDLAMHGYTHEFKFSKLTNNEQEQRIVQGKIILDNVLDTPVVYFCPPWNAVNNNSLRILKKHGFQCFSGYMGEKMIRPLRYLNCNCNLISGPLGDFKEIVENNKTNKKDILLLPLLHTNYDFKETNLEQLDSLLNKVSQYDQVVFKSFSEMLHSHEYNEFLDLVNAAGYKKKL